jgi:hypothetical protein
MDGQRSCPRSLHSLSSAHCGSRTKGADVKLINTDGLALIGPGSEWFWTALTGLILAVTFLGIYRQFSLQAHASANEQLAEFRREAYSEEMLRFGLDVLVALRDHKDPADIPDAAVLGIGDYWEDMAILARTGHRDIKLLWRYDSASTQIVWAWLAPWTHRVRAESRFGLPSYRDLEWLAGVMAEMDTRAGRPAITPAIVASHIESMITLHQDLIRYAQLARAVNVESPQAMRAALPATAAAVKG